MGRRKSIAASSQIAIIDSFFHPCNLNSIGRRRSFGAVL